MTNARWQMTNGRSQMARWKRRIRVWDKIPILSLKNERTTRLESCPTRHGRNRPNGAGSERGEERDKRWGITQKAQNKANLETKKVLDSPALKSEMVGLWDESKARSPGWRRYAHAAIGRGSIDWRRER